MAGGESPAPDKGCLSAHTGHSREPPGDWGRSPPDSGVMPPSGHKKGQSKGLPGLVRRRTGTQSRITFPARVPFLLIGCIRVLQEHADGVRQLGEKGPGQRLRSFRRPPTPVRQRPPGRGRGDGASCRALVKRPPRPARRPQPFPRGRRSILPGPLTDTPYLSSLVSWCRTVNLLNTSCWGISHKPINSNSFFCFVESAYSPNWFLEFVHFRCRFSQ